MGKQHSWEGIWISAGEKGPLLRRSFEWENGSGQVYALVAGLGWHELYVNGKKADSRVLSPVVTQYEKRVSYIRYDITALLKPGKNALGVMLGNGWYNCRFPKNVWNFDSASWIDVPKLLCNVVADGRVILSASSAFGASQMYLYDFGGVLADRQGIVWIDEAPVPLYYLDSDNCTGILHMPPHAEEITI